MKKCKIKCKFCSEKLVSPNHFPITSQNNWSDTIFICILCGYAYCKALIGAKVPPVWVTDDGFSAIPIQEWDSVYDETIVDVLEYITQPYIIPNGL